MKNFIKEIEKHYLRYEDFNNKIISINQKISSLEEKQKEINDELTALKSKRNSLIQSRNDNVYGELLVVIGNYFLSLKRKTQSNQEEE